MAAPQGTETKEHVFYSSSQLDSGSSAFLSQPWQCGLWHLSDTSLHPGITPSLPPAVPGPAVHGSCPGLWGCCWPGQGALRPRVVCVLLGGGNRLGENVWGRFSHLFSVVLQRQTTATCSRSSGGVTTNEFMEEQVPQSCISICSCKYPPRAHSLGTFRQSPSDSCRSTDGLWQELQPRSRADPSGNVRLARRWNCIHCFFKTRRDHV